MLWSAQVHAELSDGAFDVTVGPVVRLWRRARKEGKLPEADELRAALPMGDNRIRRGLKALKAAGRL